MHKRLLSEGTVILSLLFSAGVQPAAGQTPQETVLKLLQEDRHYTPLPESLFHQLGWALPDQGAHVKALADAAPGSAFYPEELEKLPSEELGYQAMWHVIRYRYYGLDWDITGLQLIPNQPLSDMPTIAIINGGSANWYEFFLDPLNNPGLGQYLAQRVPVLLITIPGNYKPGGWTQPNEERIPAYLLTEELSSQEARVRNSVYTFRLVLEGVRRMIEETIAGPLLVVGHSTAGEIPWLLLQTSLKDRLPLYLGWGSGGPARLARELSTGGGVAGGPNVGRPVWELRPRSPQEYVRSYVGPLNPVPGESKLEVARGWFERVGRRRPHFKQVLQSTEHGAAIGQREGVEREIREALAEAGSSVNAEKVLADLFSTHHVPLTGYEKMLFMVAGRDGGHWNREDPEKGREMVVVTQLRKRNPDIPIRILVMDLPMSHYGHIEKPRELAGAFLLAARWLTGR